MEQMLIFNVKTSFSNHYFLISYARLGYQCHVIIIIPLSCAHLPRMVLGKKKLTLNVTFLLTIILELLFIPSSLDPYYDQQLKCLYHMQFLIHLHLY